MRGRAPRSLRLILERHSHHHPAAGNTQHLGQRRRTGVPRQMLEQVYGVHGVGAPRRQRESRSASGCSVQRNVQPCGDITQQPGGARNEIESGYAKPELGQLERSNNQNLWMSKINGGSYPPVRPEGSSKAGVPSCLPPLSRQLSLG